MNQVVSENRKALADPALERWVTSSPPFIAIALVVAALVMLARRYAESSRRRLDHEDNQLIAQDCDSHAARFTGLAEAAEQAGNLTVANDYRTRADDQRRRAARLRRRR